MSLTNAGRNANWTRHGKHCGLEPGGLYCRIGRKGESDLNISYACTTELQAPIVVFDDADLVSAVNGAAFASFVASGQTCVSGTRLIVQESVYDTFMELFLVKVKSIRTRMGDRQSVFVRRILRCV